MKSGALHLNLISSDNGRSRIEITQDIIGGGANANIHPVLEHEDLVVKLYHDPYLDPNLRDKISAMLAKSPNLPSIRDNGHDYVQIAWPTGIVEDPSGQFVGFAMPKVSLKHTTTLKNLLIKKTRRVMGLPDYYGYRVTAAANLATLVAALHSCKHYIVDLKPQILNVYLDKFIIALLDCDSLNIKGKNGRRFKTHNYTDGYIAPEALQRKMYPQALGEAQDRFALAVIIFQLLNRGIHPFQGVPRLGTQLPPTSNERVQRYLYAYGQKPNDDVDPSLWSIHNFLEDGTRELFDRSFGKDPLARPAAAVWRDHLQQLADPETGLISTCRHYKDHGMFTKGCGFCHVDKSVKAMKKHPAPTALVKRPQKAVLSDQSPQQAAPETLQIPEAPQAPEASPPSGKPSLWRKAVIPLAAAGVLIFIFGAIMMYPLKVEPTDIHKIVLENDQETFFKLADRSQIVWNELTLEDARHAMAFKDERMFCAIIENMHLDSVPYDKAIFDHLTGAKRIKAFQTYIKHASDVPMTYAALRQIVATDSPEIIQSYRKRIENRFTIGELYAEAFLYHEIDVLKQILQWGADPEMVIEITNHRKTAEVEGDHSAAAPKLNPYRLQHQIVEKLYAQQQPTPNTGFSEKCPYNLDSVGAFCRRFKTAFRIPGTSHVRDLKQFWSMLNIRQGMVRVTPTDPSSPSGKAHRYPYYLSFEVHPLTIAVLDADLEATQTLLSAGAKLNRPIPNHGSLPGIASTPEINQALTTHQKPEHPIAHAIWEDNPEKMTAAIKKAHNDQQWKKSNILSHILANGSLSCLESLKLRWKELSRLKPLRYVVKAYQSGHPLMLNYYLNHILSEDESYSYRQIKKQCPDIDDRNGRAVEYEILGRLAKNKSKRIKISEFIMQIAEEDKSWAMSFVVDDHLSQWSDLHLAVLSDDPAQVNKLLRINPERIEERDARGRTPLALAIHYQCAKSYQALIERNPHLNARDDGGRTPLMHAVAYGNVPMVKELLESGAKLYSNTTPQCKTAIRISSANLLIADQIMEMATDRKMGGVPEILISRSEKIRKTHKLIQEASGKAPLIPCR